VTEGGTPGGAGRVRCVVTRPGVLLLVRPLQHGEVKTVMALFRRLGERSRRARFNGAKPCLKVSELRRLAAIDEHRHALVAYLPDDPAPVGIARLVRDRDSAEIAVAVADEHQRQGVGTALAEELVADAREAGITELTALVSRDNPDGLSLMRRIARVFEVQPEGSDLAIRAAIA
jgi:GNAT superfamily N-acetyltransferase